MRSLKFRLKWKYECCGDLGRGSLQITEKSTEGSAEEGATNNIPYVVKVAASGRKDELKQQPSTDVVLPLIHSVTVYCNSVENIAAVTKTEALLSRPKDVTRTLQVLIGRKVQQTRNGNDNANSASKEHYEKYLENPI